MKLTIKDGRDHFYTFDTNRILLLTATDEENIRQVEFSTEENGEEVSWTSEVLTGSDGIKYVQVPNEFLNGNYSRLVCYYVALDSNGEYTRQKEIFRIRARQEPQDYYLTYSERVTFASIKALTEQYKATTKQYMDTTEGFKDNAGRSAELASKYAENNEDVAVEPGKYSAKHWSIKAEAAKETAVQKATEAGTSEVNSKTYMESAQSAKQDAETAKNTANTILEQVQSKGTEITNFVATSKTEIETQKNESVNAVKSVYQTDLNELKGDLVELKDDIVIHDDNTNFINKSKMKKGYINSEGGVNINETSYHTDYIELKEGVSYNWAWLYKTYYAFYNENKSLIASYATLGNLPTPFTIPAGAKYGRFSIAAEKLEYNYFISTHGGTIPEYAVIVDESKLQKLTTLDNKIENIDLSSYKELKSIFSLGVGQIDNGKFLSNYPYRVSSNKNEKFDNALFFTINDGYQVGYCTFDTLDQETTTVWSGWKTGSFTIPKNTIFKIQCARASNETSSRITDAYDNDIYNNIYIKSYDSNEKLGDRLEQVERKFDPIDFSSFIPLKIEKTYGWLWSQGVCSVGDSYVGFEAQSETVTGKAKIGSFENIENHTVVSHELGHCNTADYNDDIDMMVTADVDTVYFVKNMASVVSNKKDMLLSDDNIITVSMSGLNGEGFSGSCFGECKNIVYLIRNESHSNFMKEPMKYIYKCFIGLGSNNLYSLFDSDNYGTFIENCGENEFNGTIHILKTYELELPTEVQDVKYVGTCLAISTDTRINSVLSSFITCVSLDDVATVKKILWIPTYYDDGTVREAECEGMCLLREFAYVAVFLKNPVGVKVFKFRNSILF